LAKNLSTVEQRLHQTDIAVAAEHVPFRIDELSLRFCADFVHPCADRQRDLDMLGIPWRLVCCSSSVSARRKPRTCASPFP
jgi:hypothetical protein